MIHPRVFKEMEFRDVLVQLVKLLRPDTYVELGVKRGYTFNAVAPHVGRAVAVDLCTKWVTRLTNVEMYQSTTDDFAQWWKIPIDVLFIDADHSYEQVKKDFDNFAPLVVEGTGLIFLHDTHPMFDYMLAPNWSGTAWKMAYQIRTDANYKDFEIVTIPGPFAGISIVRKIAAGRHLSWKEGFCEACNRTVRG